MKRNLLYLIALVATLFAACDPMKDTLTDLNLDGQPYTKALSITVTANYATTDAANKGIVNTLNSTYAQLGEGSTASVTYTYKTNTVKPADSLFANVQYTVTDPDFALVGNTFKSFSDAQVLAFLDVKFPQATTPVNKLVLLSYPFFLSGATASAGTPVTDAFILLETGWKKIDLVKPAQYALVGRSVNNMFISADAANLATYFNSFLKDDASIMATAKSGDIRYITYRQYQSATVSYQKVYKLMFDGANWLPTETLGFLKKDGKWIPDPNIYYQLVTTDYTTVIFNSTAGTTANRANLASFKSYNVIATNGTQWTPDEIKASLIVVLNNKYSNAAVDPSVFYVVSYYQYAGTYSYPKMTFVKTASGFVFVK